MSTPNQSAYIQQKFNDWMLRVFGTIDHAEAAAQIRNLRGCLTIEQLDDGRWYAEDTADDTFYGDGRTEDEAIINAERHAYWEGWCDANEWG